MEDYSCPCVDRKDNMVAGQIDSIWVDAAGGMHMVDWKRCAKHLNPDEGRGWGRFGKAPCEFFVDNAFSHYVLQQNLYAAILEDFHVH